MNSHLGSILCCALLGIGTACADDPAPLLLPFQGRLSLPDGRPVADGPRIVRFQLFTTPDGIDAAWSGEVHRTTVNGGLVNVVLGSKSPLSGLDFGRTLYLEITVDVSGAQGVPDQTIDETDPPLRPRQVILPAPFARESETTRRVAGVPAATFGLGLVPVGSVISYYGDPAGLPANWKICDGSTIDDPDSPFNGQALPNLQETFIRGASIFYPLGTTGGQDWVDDHSHYASLSGSSYIPVRGLNGWHGYQVPSRSTEFFPHIYSFSIDNSVGQTDQDTHGHSGTAYTSGTTWSAGAHDNRPRFISLHYVMRVR